MMVFAVAVFILITIFLTAFWWLGSFIIAFALLGSLGQYLRWQTTQFVVTTDRLIARNGVLTKRGIEIPLDRIMNISYSQSVQERLLGTGDLVIESAGENGRQPFSDVADPSGVQNLIYRQVEIYQGKGKAPSAEDGMGDEGKARHQMSIPEQIEKLDELRNRGILSDEEFDAKKRTLLDRL